MIKSAIKSLIEQCTRWPWAVVGVAVVLAAAASVYAADHFAINTDINRLISPDLPWRQRELAFSKAFPQGYEVILVVIDAPTSEAATQAATTLTDTLAGRKDLFRSVDDIAETPFFARNAFLFLTTDDVAATAGQLAQSAPLIQVLASDPSLRGLTQALSFGLMGAQAGEGGLAPLARVFDSAAAAVETVLDGKSAHFSWRELVSGKTPTTDDLRRFIEVHPVLDYSALEPGKKATDAIRKAAAGLQLKEKLGAGVRLTGSVPIADQEFATIQEGAVRNLIATAAIVLVILWLALRSARIIAAVALTVAVGLAITAAVGLMMVGALNLISVAFAVLFIGIGVDFGIQFSVRYRAERHEVDDLRAALSNAGDHIATPLALAATATAAGFLSFVPTDYRGVSELGQIAGVGMIIAFIGCITVLPALLKIFNPPGESVPLGYAALAPVDGFMERYRMPILIGASVLIVAALPLLYFLQFDFNPIDLRNPKAEIDRHLSRRARRRFGRRQCRGRGDALAGRGATGRAAPEQGAASVAGEDACELRARRSGAQDRTDRQRREDARSGARCPAAPGAERCGKPGRARERATGAHARRRQPCGGGSGGGQAAGGRSRQAGGGEPGAARERASGIHYPAARRARRLAQCAASAAGERADAAAGAAAPVGDARRARARAGAAEGRSQHQRRDRQFRASG